MLCEWVGCSQTIKNEEVTIVVALFNTHIVVHQAAVGSSIAPRKEKSYRGQRLPTGGSMNEDHAAVGPICDGHGIQ